MKTCIRLSFFLLIWIIIPVAAPAEWINTTLTPAYSVSIQGQTAELTLTVTWQVTSSDRVFRSD